MVGLTSEVSYRPSVVRTSPRKMQAPLRKAYWKLPNMISFSFRLRLRERREEEETGVCAQERPTSRSKLKQPFAVLEEEAMGIPPSPKTIHPETPLGRGLCGSVGRAYFVLFILYVGGPTAGGARAQRHPDVAKKEAGRGGDRGCRIRGDLGAFHSLGHSDARAAGAAAAAGPRADHHRGVLQGLEHSLRAPKTFHHDQHQQVEADGKVPGRGTAKAMLIIAFIALFILLVG